MAQEFQLSNYKRNIFSKLSDQKRAKFKAITTLDKVLGLETSFAGNNALGWLQDNGNRSNQESKFDFLATHECLVKIDKGQQKIKIIHTRVAPGQ